MSWTPQRPKGQTVSTVNESVYQPLTKSLLSSLNFVPLVVTNPFGTFPRSPVPKRLGLWVSAAARAVEPASNVANSEENFMGHNITVLKATDRHTEALEVIASWNVFRSGHNR
jgi:hypothetical protein